MKVLCVKSRDRWCAASKKNLTAKERAALIDVRTLCRHYVTTHLGIEQRAPTCPECEAILDDRADKKNPKPPPKGKVVLGYRAATMNAAGEVLQYTDPMPTRYKAVHLLLTNLDSWISQGYAAVSVRRVLGTKVK